MNFRFRFHPDICFYVESITYNRGLVLTPVHIEVLAKEVFAAQLHKTLHIKAIVQKKNLRLFQIDC